MTKFNYEKERLQHLARQTASKYNLNPDLFLRQINQESGFNPKAKSHVGALGLGQIMPATAKGMGLKPDDLLDPVKNLDAAARIMQNNLKTYGGDYSLALAAYNGGGGAINFVKKKLGKMPTGQEWIQFMSERRKKKGDDPNAWHTQTLNYVNKIMPQQVIQSMDATALAQEAPKNKPVSQHQESGQLPTQEATIPTISQQINPEQLQGILAYFNQQNQGVQENQQAIQDQQRALAELQKSLNDREIAQRELAIQSQQHQQLLNEQARQKANRDNLILAGQSAIQSLQNIPTRTNTPVQLGYQESNNYTPKFQMPQGNPWMNMG